MWFIKLSLVFFFVFICAIGLAAAAGSIVSQTQLTFLSWENNGDVVSLDLRTRLFYNHTRHPATEETFVWSPDGSRIAFTSNRDFNRDIFVMNADGRNRRQLTRTITDNLHPTWSPDGRYLAYVHDVSYEDANQDIYIVNVETREARQLTTAVSDDTMPVWSPDGRKIAYLSNRVPEGGGILPKHKIYVVDVENGTETLVVDQLGSVEMLAWSPDGTMIAFSNAIDTRVVSLASGEVLSLLKRAMQPLWSPDSRQLLITVQRQNNFDTVLCVFQLEDETLDCRTNGAVRDSQGAWSPDGRQIAFVSFTSRQVMVSGMGGTSTALLQFRTST
jgi:Tol biopolymer transport system component